MAKQKQKQKHARAELEKTLDTLSEEELDALAVGKFTDDVKKFFQSEKGKKVLELAGTIVGTAAITIPTTIVLTAAYIKRKHSNGYADEGNLNSIFDPELVFETSASTDA